jgi:hypothetical protein
MHGGAIDQQLSFDQDLAVDDEIRRKPDFKSDISINDWDLLLNNRGMASLAYFISEAFFVNRLQQTRPKGPMNAERRGNNRLCNLSILELCVLCVLCGKHPITWFGEAAKRAIRECFGK